MPEFALRVAYLLDFSQEEPPPQTRYLGETIGEKKIIGKETVDFDTYCKLIEIFPQAQKPFIIKKTTVIQNEKGEFLGSSFTEETHMISSSKIIFVDKKGESYNSWIGELVKVGTDTVTTCPLTNDSSTN